MFSRTLSYPIVVVLIGLASSACYRGVDYSKVKCLADGSGCPKNYVCSQTDKGYGLCVLKTGSLDGGAGKTSTPTDGAVVPGPHRIPSREPTM